MGKSPELLDVTKRDRVRYSNTLGMLSMKSFVLGSYVRLGSKISELLSCLACHLLTSHLRVVQYERSKTPSSCNCLPGVKPDSSSH